MSSHSLIIKLSEIPEEGKSFQYSSKNSPELAQALKELIHTENFDIDFTIRPINSKDYHLSGRLAAASPQDCSRCGEAFKYSLNKALTEVLIPKTNRDFSGKYSKPNHIIQDSESSIDYVEFKNEEFDVASYIHEAIAIDIPFNPSPALDDKQSCTLCHKSFEKGAFEYNEEMGVEKKNPFGGLKDILKDLKNPKLN